MSRALILQYLLGLVLMVLFAYMNANYPDKTWLFFILYFTAFMVIMMVVTGRHARSVLRDLEEVKSGEILYSSKPDEVLKLREKDFQLTQPELMAQFKASMIPLLSLVVFILVFYIPGFREFFTGLGKSMALDEKTANFLSFLALYGFFYAFSLATGLYARRLQSKTGSLIIATSYTVTSKGIIVDERTPVKFPWKGDIIVDSRRKFVQLNITQQIMGTSITQKIRLYNPEPSKLANILKSYKA
ncbi:DUF2208 domain-containing protein [Thermofilum pendens]|uniref:Membrane protein-like protein n=1 Tax=Thermofilum pendens (strain DSM 2475 / Hrk 5) TaxID=368408 RepID=A1RYG7_THEPD|nr:DUF2208 domain-containing protein [Thermofilum pendens]ABL78247.1 membrane protein-like protein [Thermofilum pendens Hrk 5]